jgi:Polyketide cyclase / dehydrase and lipid transport
MSSFCATVQTEIAAQQAAVFDHIVPIDLTSIFTGYGPLPAVTGVQNQTGGWDVAGQTRTVTLSDGSSARELLTKYDYPHYFSYTVSDFSGVLRFLTISANGEWWFETNPSSGATDIKWSYAFNARSLFAAPILWLITNVLWRGYMRKALMLGKSQIEGRSAQPQ